MKEMTDVVAVATVTFGTAFHFFAQKIILVVSRIRTRIAGVEGEDAVH